MFFFLLVCVFQFSAITWRRREGKREKGREERKKKERKKEKKREEERGKGEREEGRKRKKENRRKEKREGCRCSAPTGIWHFLAALSLLYLVEEKRLVLSVRSCLLCPQRCALALLWPAGEAVALDSLRASELGMLPPASQVCSCGERKDRAQPLGLSGSHFYYTQT